MNTTRRGFLKSPVVGSVGAVINAAGEPVGAEPAGANRPRAASPETQPFLAEGEGARVRTVEAKFREVKSVKDFGAIGDGRADDTRAIQAAVDSMANLRGSSGRLILPRGHYRITASIVFPHAWARNQIDFQGSLVTYDGPSNPDAAIFHISKNLFYENVFENGRFNAAQKAGYVFYAVGEGDLYAIKANWVRNCNMQYATVAAVQIGNQTSSGRDQDGADWVFDKCYFISIAPGVGCRVDGDNCLNTNWRHCWFNADKDRYSGGHLQLWKGGGFYVHDAFFGFLGRGTDTYCIEVREANLAVFGANTEEGNFLRTSGMVAERKNIFVSGVMVNEATASLAPEYAVHAPVGHLVIESCTFGKSNVFPRKVYVGDTVMAQNVYLGTNSKGDIVGKWELDNPDRCFIEGQYLPSVKVLNANPYMALWPGAAEGDYPYGFGASKFGALTVRRSTAHARQGCFTANVVVRSGHLEGQNIDGLQVVIPVAFSLPGMRSIAVAVRGTALHLRGTSTVNLRMAYLDPAGGVLGANNVRVHPEKDGSFEIFLSLRLGDGHHGVSHFSATIGTGTNGASGDIYVDSFYLVPLAGFTINGGEHWRTLVDVWTKYPRQIEGVLEYLKAGVLATSTGDSIQRMTWGRAAPTAGTWRRGDVRWNEDAAPGRPPGWICVASGAPGIWRALTSLASA